MCKMKKEKKSTDLCQCDLIEKFLYNLKKKRTRKVKYSECLKQLMKCWWERSDKASRSSGLQRYGMWKPVSYHYLLVDHFDMVNKKVKGFMLFAPSVFLLGTVASLFLALSAVISWPHEAFSQELKSPPSLPSPPASHGMVLLSAVWLNIPLWEEWCVFQGLFTGVAGFALSREETIFMMVDLPCTCVCYAFKGSKLFLSLSRVTGSATDSASQGIHWLVSMLRVQIGYNVLSRWKAACSSLLACNIGQKNTLTGCLKEHSFFTECVDVTFCQVSYLTWFVFKIINVVCRPQILFHTEFLFAEVVMLLYYHQNKGVLQHCY